MHSLLTVVLNEAQLPEPVHKKLTRARVVPMISARLSRYAAPARNRLDAAPRPTLPGRPAVERLGDEREVQDGEPVG